MGFMFMYGEILQTRFQYNEESEELAKEIFDHIKNIKLNESTPGDKDYFDFKDFRKAKDQTPEIFEWINQPEKFIKELSSNQKGKKEQNVSLVTFKKYH